MDPEQEELGITYWYDRYARAQELQVQATRQQVRDFWGEVKVACSQGAMVCEGEMGIEVGNLGKDLRMVLVQKIEFEAPVFGMPSVLVSGVHEGGMEMKMFLTEQQLINHLPILQAALDICVPVQK